MRSPTSSAPRSTLTRFRSSSPKGRRSSASPTRRSAAACSRTEACPARRSTPRASPMPGGSPRPSCCSRRKLEAGVRTAAVLKEQAPGAAGEDPGGDGRRRPPACRRGRIRAADRRPRRVGGAMNPRPAGTPPAREGPRRRALPRAARRAGARARGAPLAGALQPRVPPGLRRDAAPVPAHAPAGARGGAAAEHRPHVADICFTVGLRSVGSFTTSFGRALRLSPTAYRAAHPPAASAGADPDLRAARVRRGRSPAVFEKTAARRRANVAADRSTTTGGSTMLKQLTTRATCGSTTRTRRSPSTPTSSGMELREDVTVPEMGNFRWLTVGPPGQGRRDRADGVPGPPVFDAETRDQIQGSSRRAPPAASSSRPTTAGRPTRS